MIDMQSYGLHLLRLVLITLTFSHTSCAMYLNITDPGPRSSYSMFTMLSGQGALTSLGNSKASNLPRSPYRWRPNYQLTLTEVRTC
jgi:hypothetical protein